LAIVVLAEKPSVARDIARVLGAQRNADGWLEGNGYRVTWALGHLVHFAEPDEYGAEWAGRWSAAQLPMIPERWRLKTDQRTVKQYKLVKQLLDAPDTARLICATDAGREGENIFRLIYEHARCKKPFDRLWVSSLTDEAIREGFARLKPGTAFDDLAHAARARAQADWLVGMNLTRAYTVHNRVLCTIGRVQTPTLAMIVARDQTIASFTKVYYYELLAHLAEGFDAKYAKDGETRIDKKAEAERLHRALSPHQTGTVRRVQRKVRHNRPPPLYDLTNLQRDANRRFGFTAAQVLEYAQALYETHKLISYPRTESHHIAEDMLPELPGILRKLEHPLAGEALARLEAGHKLGKAYVDRTKLTDHHAILPTGKVPPPSLPPPLRKVYDLVATRFVAVFLPDQVVEETQVTLDIGGATFLARGSRELEEGWKRAEPRRPSAPNEGDGTAADETRRPLPPLTEGQTVHVESMEIQEKETLPPRPYEDATLLAAMKNAGREIEDEALASAMKDRGLGTPATRAETIEKLIRTGYVERKGKQLRATEKGHALIGLVAEPLKSPELTAAWEQRLKDIEQGEAAVDAFYGDIVAFVRDLVPKVAEGPALTPEQAATARAAGPRAKGRGGRGPAVRPSGLGTCPVCGQGEVTETAKAYGCSRYRDGCGLTIWKTVAGLKLRKDQVRQLLTQGHTDRIEGFQSKAGRPFAARLKLSKVGKVEFDFDSSPAESRGDAPPSPNCDPRTRQDAGSTPPIPDGPLSCPKCGRGHIIEGRRGFGCDRYREGCDFVVWKEVGGKQLSEADIRRLIAHGRTGLIRGFTGAGGTPLDARLKLDAEWKVVFEFAE
jgi:DNA topoisomerase-3